MSKRALILAGGKGTRLRPYTVTLPKPLVPVGDMPILEIVIRQLVASGFDHITMAVNHLADLIKAFFGDGSKWGIRIDYSLEDQPLGTMGPLTLAQQLPENFLVMNGDILTDMDYAAFYDFHVQRGNIFTVSSCKVKNTCDYGVLESGDDGYLIGFREKPVTYFQVSMGIYMVSRRVLDYIPKNQPYGFDQLMLELMARQQPAFIKPFEGYWLDIGRQDDYQRAIEEFETNKQRLLK